MILGSHCFYLRYSRSYGRIRFSADFAYPRAFPPVYYYRAVRRSPRLISTATLTVVAVLYHHQIFLVSVFYCIVTGTLDKYYDYVVRSEKNTPSQMFIICDPTPGPQYAESEYFKKYMLDEYVQGPR